MREAKSKPPDLHAVEANVMRALKPVAPPPAFRARLRDGLQSVAQYNTTLPVVADQQSNPASWALLISAVTLGAILGFIVIVLRARHAAQTTARESMR